MKISNNFLLEEFVPQSVFKKYGKNSTWFLSENLVDAAEFFRLRYGKPMKINDWVFGGELQYRGFRPPTVKVGSSLSQHRFGRAFDFNVAGISPEEIYADITTNWTKDWPITTIEDVNDTPTWTHVDLRWTGLEHLLVVKA